MNLLRDPELKVPIRNLSLGVICVAAALLFSGCAVGPKYQRPSVDVPPAYKEVGNWKPAEPSEQRLGGNWSMLRSDAVR